MYQLVIEQLMNFLVLMIILEKEVFCSTQVINIFIRFVKFFFFYFGKKNKNFNFSI